LLTTLAFSVATHEASQSPASFLPNILQLMLIANNSPLFSYLSDLKG